MRVSRVGRQKITCADANGPQVNLAKVLPPVVAEPPQPRKRFGRLLRRMNFDRRPCIRKLQERPQLFKVDVSRSGHQTREPVGDDVMKMDVPDSIGVSSEELQLFAVDAATSTRIAGKSVKIPTLSPGS